MSSTIRTTTTALFAQIAKKNPKDVDGYKRFLTYSENVFREGYEKLGHEAFLDFGTMMKAAPQLMRYEAFRSVYAMVSRYIEDEQLREAFSFHSLLVGGNPFKTSAIYALIHALEKKWGVWFPRGGTGALVKGMVKLFEDLGGRVMIGNGVKAIRAEGAKVTGVTTADGWSGEFDAVASNGDIVHTYRDLLGAHPRGQQAAKMMKWKSFSPSLFVTYFGLKRQHPDIKHHTIIFGNRYRALLDDIYKNGVLADDFSLYLHHPTATDPAMAPPGCSAFYVLSPVPHMGKYKGDWEIEGKLYADRILDTLEATMIPGLRDDLVTMRTFTPQGLQHRTERPSRQRLQPRAGAVAERLLPHPQPRRRAQEPVFRRRRHASGRRHPRRRRLGQGDGQADDRRPRRDRHRPQQRGRARRRVTP